MRKIAFLAVALATVSVLQPGQAGEPGFSFGHVSPHAGRTLHHSHQRFEHLGRIWGKPRHYKPHWPGSFGRGGLVLEFRAGDFVLKFGQVPRVPHRRFGHGHRHPGLHFGLGRPRHFRPWHHPSFALEDRHDLPEQLGQFRGSIPRAERDRAGGHVGAPPEALLAHLEQLGFRHVTALLRERSR